MSEKPGFWSLKRWDGNTDETIKAVQQSHEQFIADHPDQALNDNRKVWIKEIQDELESRQKSA